MLKNYFKIAWRNLWRNKAFSFINIAGLAIGIAASLIIFTIVQYELSYDRFQPNYKNIYRIVTQDKYSGGFTHNPGVPGAAIEAMRSKMPEVSFAVINSIYHSQITINNTSNKNNKFIEEQGIFFCEADFFSVFSYHWLAGNANALKQPNTVVLSEKAATKYFGKWQTAINKTITLDNNIDLKVAGIIKNVPYNSDFPLSILVSFPTLKSNAAKYYFNLDWDNLSSNLQLYALLPKNATEANFVKQINNFNIEHYSNARAGSKRTNIAQPLSALHFNNDFGIFGDHTISISTIWTLSLIGIFIILMACINFINLATAQAVGRSKEVGVRKVLGSNRLQLFLQVMGETVLIVLIALVLALGLASLCLPYVKNIASIQENLSLLNVQTVAFVLLILIVVTVLSGFYPSLIVSGYKPSLALKNKIASARVGGISLRRALVILQFAISQVLIIGTIIAVSQMNFINQANLGFNKEAILLLSANTDSAIVSRMPTFKHKLLQTQGVQSVSMANDAPSSANNWSANFAFNHKADEAFPVSLKSGDEDYLNTFGLQLLAGRFYSKSDTANEYVINETLLHKLGLKNPQDAVDKDIRLGSQPWKKIVGVVKDFKTQSLKQSISPILLGQNHAFYGLTAIKISSSNLLQTQKNIGQVWDDFFPEYAYTSTFMDDNINRFYEQETHLELLYKIFAGLAIFISCLGLYGLVSFMAVQKTKEIGVRKVLGASVKNIIYLFSKEFTILVIVAFIIAGPLAYLMMHAWLNDFAYRIDITAWVFVLAIIISVVIAWITVAYKAVKAAKANPVKSLRSE